GPPGRTPTANLSASGCIHRAISCTIVGTGMENADDVPWRSMMNVDRSELPVEIRPADAAQLDFLEEQFSPGSLSRYHHRRFAVQQQGDGVYLIAWHDDEPVGHFLLLWDGPTEDPTGKYPPHTASLESGATKPAFQGRGVGTRMIAEAERRARAKGY